MASLPRSTVQPATSCRNNALRFEVSRLEKDQRTKESDRKARLERLKREMAQLKGQMATTAETIERLKYEIEKHHIRAPVAGRLGEVANLRMGAFASEGDRLGAVVPPGKVKLAADLRPSVALGRSRPGQSGRLRLKGFPWTQYGSISAAVASVASEVRDGWIRVELTVHPDPASPIPLQHGLPGTLEVQVEAQAHLHVAGQAAVAALAAQIRRKLHERLGITVEVTVLPPKTLERSVGKAQRVRDLRASA
jgi:membrane fusion protein (multidrug efflux system)